MCKLDPLGINDANLHVDKFQYRGSTEQARSMCSSRTPHIHFVRFAIEPTPVYEQLATDHACLYHHASNTSVPR